MNNSGDAAEQIVRMGLEGVEVAARITGTAAKEIALMIIAALKSDKEKTGGLKTKGRERLTSMLKSGKPLEIFTVKESDLQKFAQGAKQYGIVYCVLRNSKNTQDGLCDIMVKADDAPKISRLVERFKFAAVDKARIESEIVTSKAEKYAGAEPGAPDAGDTEKLLDELLGTPEGKAQPDKPEVIKTEPVKDAAKDATVNPYAAETAKTSLSEPISESRSKSAGGTSSKPSVKAELREITAAKKEKEADAPTNTERPAPDKSKDKQAVTHKQPTRSKKTRPRKSKAR
jgi:hypothetical protein